ncbi:unnamed protein product [Sphagnum tenellum]
MMLPFSEDHRRLLHVVVRDLAEEVVDLVRADVVQGLVGDAVVPVNRAQLALDEAPLAEGDEHQPGREDKHGDQIVRRQVDEPERRRVRNQREHGPRGHAAQGYGAADSVPDEHGVERVEVVGAPGRVALDHVGEPADAEPEQRDDGLVHLLLDGLAFPDGVEDLVLVDVGRVLVVLVVRQLPGVVGHEDHGVEDVADDVVDHAAVGEGAVSAVVGEDEEAGHERALPVPVEREGDEVDQDGGE